MTMSSFRIPGVSARIRRVFVLSPVTGREWLTEHGGSGYYTRSRLTTLPIASSASLEAAELWW